MTNAYYALLRMKSRLAEEDYEKLSVRVTGGVFFAIAIYLLIVRWAEIWK